MSKKKIIVIVPSFHTGGTVTSLMNFVTLVDKEKFDISVFAITNIGVNKDSVARYCNVIGYTPGPLQKTASKKDIMRDKIFCVVKLVKKSLCAIGIDLSPFLFRFYANKLDRGNYDYVIAFQEGQATLLGSYFKNGFKIAWVRSEYTRFIKRVNSGYSQVYERYNRIVSVSQASMNSFLSVLPQYNNIAVVQYNFLNDNRILQLSKSNADGMDDDGIFTIISVGRIDPVKRVREVPKIARKLMDKGIIFRWIILGGVAKKEEFEDLSDAKERLRTDCVLLLGNKTNPYPYILKSNLLVSLSTSETFNNTLTEAKILGVPVVTTDYPCAYESIKNGKEGLIVPFEKITDAIESMIINRDNVYDKIKEELSSYQYNKEVLLKSLYDNVLS